LELRLGGYMSENRPKVVITDCDHPSVEIEKIASLGFDGAELHVGNPKDLNVENVIKTIKENNLEVPTIGTGQAYTEEGLSFSDSNEIVRKMAVKRIKDQMIFASHFNSQVTIGSIMGKIE